MESPVSNSQVTCFQSDMPTMDSLASSPPAKKKQAPMLPGSEEKRGEAPQETHDWHGRCPSESSQSIGTWCGAAPSPFASPGHTGLGLPGHTGFGLQSLP